MSSQDDKLCPSCVSLAEQNSEIKIGKGRGLWKICRTCMLENALVDQDGVCSDCHREFETDEVDFAWFSWNCADETRFIVVCKACLRKRKWYQTYLRNGGGEHTTSILLKCFQQELWMQDLDGNECVFFEDRQVNELTSRHRANRIREWRRSKKNRANEAAS